MSEKLLIKFSHSYRSRSRFVIHDFKYATNVKVNYVLGSKKVSIDKISNTKMSLGKLEVS